MKVILIRHGETKHNQEHRIQGNFDSELNAFGIAQAQKVGDKLRKVEKVDRIYTSDLQRASKTAEILANNEIEVVPVRGFRERYMGVIENMLRSDAKALCRKEGKASLLEYGESATSLQDRLEQAYHDVVNRSLQENLGTIVIVSHGSALNNLMSRLISKGLKFQNYHDKNRATKMPRWGNCNLTYIEDDVVTKYCIEWAESIVREQDLI